jgi:hypothetical protein
MVALLEIGGGRSAPLMMRQICGLLIAVISWTIITDAAQHKVMHC